MKYQGESHVDEKHLTWMKYQGESHVDEKDLDEMEHLDKMS
jgi:hypothetical protein